jgi:hypothetical protein
MDDGRGSLRAPECAQLAGENGGGPPRNAAMVQPRDLERRHDFVVTTSV